MIFRRHGPSEVDRAARDVRVDVNATGENNHPGGIDRTTADDRRNKLAAINTQVPDLAVNAVGGVENLSACDPNHGVPCWFTRLTAWASPRARRITRSQYHRRQRGPMGTRLNEVFEKKPNVA